MPSTDKRVDKYIAESASFARPILTHVRKLVHKSVPGVAETIKWGFPHFDYHGVMCSMAAFKEHCAFGFWKASLMSDPEKILDQARSRAMGHFGRITSLKDLPSDKVMIAYLKEAARLNEEGVKKPPREKVNREKLVLSFDFLQALAKKQNALDVFNAFSLSHRQEYAEWIAEAKTDETRKKRMATAVDWIAGGKHRNWKYERK